MPAPPDHRGRWRIVAHHLALAVVLAAVLPLAGLGAVWSADEGAMLYQATAVAGGDGWVFEHPFPEADPDGLWYPIHLSSRSPDGGYLVIAKHTVVTRLFGWVHGFGGYTGVLALSVGAGFAAAAVAARLANRLDRRSTVPTLWLVGLASPLFLGAYVAWAHTLGAALVGLGLLGLTTSGGSGLGPRSNLAAQVGGAGALGLACLMRTEATLAGIAATLALLVPVIVVAAETEGGRFRLARPAILAGAATVAGFAIDRATAIATVGPVRSSGDPWGGLPGRIEGFAHTWLRPDLSNAPHHLLFLISATALIGAGIAARRRALDSPVVVAGAAVAAVAVLARFLIEPTALIPGLVIAFPLLFAGFTLLERGDLRSETARVLAAFVVLFWLAVLATQYRGGGGGEWGGRYFAVGLPAAVPLAAVALTRRARAVTGAGRRRTLGLVLVAAMVPVAMGVLGLREARDRTAALTGRVQDQLVEPGDGGPPVVVTTLPGLGRWSWEDIDDGRWLLVEEDELAAVGARLEALGIERLLFVSVDAADHHQLLGGRFAPIEPIPERSDSSLDRIVIPMASGAGAP